MRLFVILVIVIFVFIGTCFCAIPLILKHLNSHINCNDCGCTRADRTLMKSANHQFAADLENCGIKAWGNGEKASECLKSLYPNLSTGCANCFGELQVGLSVGSTQFEMQRLRKRTLQCRVSYMHWSCCN